jgi:hypothetical protein
MILQATVQCIGVNYGEYQLDQTTGNLSNISFKFINATTDTGQTLDISDFNLRILDNGSITNYVPTQTYTMTVTAA